MINEEDNMRKVILLLPLILLVFSGCFALPAEPPMLPPPVFTPPEPWDFALHTVRLGDVRASTDHGVSFVSVNESDILFERSGLPIVEVHVSMGDIVSQGDLLVTLLEEYADIRLQELLEERNRLSRTLSQLESRFELELLNAEFYDRYVDILTFAENRSELLLEQHIVVSELNILLEDVELAHITAPINGTITQLLTAFPDMRTAQGMRVATISDLDAAAFLLRVPGANDMVVGNRYELLLGDDIHWVEVVDEHERGYTRRVEWTQAAFFDFVYFAPPITLGTRGLLIHTHGAAYNVIYVPNQFLHTVPAYTRNGITYPERTFVFIYQDGLRVPQDVVVGVRGNTSTEIISGLSSGDVIFGPRVF